MASKAKVPPHSSKAESSILGSLLLSKDAMMDVAEIVSPEMFYEDKHQRIYEAIRSLYEAREPIDVVTVSEWLKKKDDLKKIGGSSYLSELVNSVPTAAHAKGYAKIIKNHFIKREMIDSASQLVELAFDEGAEVEQVLDKAEREIFGLSQKNLRGGFVPVKEALAESFDRLDELHKRADGMRGVPTGIDDLDDALAGMQDSNLLILAARPGMGKCVTGNTLVLDPKSGRRVPISEMVEKESGSIISLDKRYKLREGKPDRFVDDGVKPVFKITTALGNELEATAVHPLLTIDGWKEVADLKTGDRVAVPRELSYFGEKSWADYKLKVLAYFLGDGGLTNSSPQFTNADKKIREDFKGAVLQFEGVKVRKVKQTGKRLRTTSLVVTQDMSVYDEYKKSFAKKLSGWLKVAGMPQRQLATTMGASPATVCMWAGGSSLPGAEYAGKLEKMWGERLDRVAGVNPVTEWLDDLGVMGISAVDKSIPDEVFELNKESLALFLNRLYACDGSVVIDKRGGVRISYASSSKNLAEQVKHLLLRFGVLAGMREKRVKYKGGKRVSYEVEVMGAKEVLRFIEKIGVIGSEEKLQEAEKIVRSKLTSKNYTKDTLPMGVWDIILKEKGDLPWRQVYKKMGRPLTHNIHCKRREPRRETVKEIGEALDSQRLIDLAKSDVYWDRIVEIEPSGKKQVFDLSVGKWRNFIAGDVVVHNTTLALNIAQHVAVEEKIPVGFFSLEMSNLELVDRLLVAQARIDAWKMKTGNLKEDEFTKLSEAMGLLADSPLYIDDTPGLSILEMRTKARRLQVEHGVKLIVVDYLQLAVGNTRYDNRVQEVQAISQGLKNLARELKIPVLALSQLNRAIEQRGSKVPQLSDLRESGCLLGDSLIFRIDTGERVRIENLVGEKAVPVLALDEDGKLVKTMISKVFSSGTKTVYQLKLKSGRSIKASGNHPFLKLSGWERLDKLEVGDRLAIPRQLDVEAGGDVMVENRLVLLAHLIGDGCYVRRQPLHYTNSDKQLIEIVRDSVEEFAVEPRVVRQENCQHLYLSAKANLGRGRRNPIVKWLDEELSIYGQRSRNKVIPEQVLQQDNGRIALFLKHLWATDGCIFVKKKGTKGPRVRIYFASSSQTMIDQVQHLLLRLGIMSRKSYTTKEDYGKVWKVEVTGKPNQVRFLKEVGCVGEKEKVVEKALTELEKIKGNPNNDVIPKEVWLLIEQKRKEKGWSGREFHKKMGWAYSGTQRHKHGVSRRRLSKIAKVMDSEELRQWAESDIYWDEVVEIEKLGREEVYDATVPKLHNFIADDILVHNSIEQDADVVTFLYRPDDDDIKNYKLGIAKHRNGPLATIDLVFKNTQVRFFGASKKGS